MKLKFKTQDFQTTAVNAAADLFAGQDKISTTFSIIDAFKKAENIITRNNGTIPSRIPPLRNDKHRYGNNSHIKKSVCGMKLVELPCYL